MSLGIENGIRREERSAESAIETNRSEDRCVRLVGAKVCRGNVHVENFAERGAFKLVQSRFFTRKLA